MLRRQLLAKQKCRLLGPLTEMTQVPLLKLHQLPMDIVRVDPSHRVMEVGVHGHTEHKGQKRTKEIDRAAAGPVRQPMPPAVECRDNHGEQHYDRQAQEPPLDTARIAPTRIQVIVRPDGNDARRDKEQQKQELFGAESGTPGLAR